MDRGAWQAIVHGSQSQTLGEKTITSTFSSVYMQFVGSAKRWQHCTLLIFPTLGSLGIPWIAAHQASLFFTISQSLL